MKKNRFYYLAMMLCTLALSFTACQKDDDDKGGKGGSKGNGFGTEKYESISGLYEVENTSSGIKSIELTAGGEYIIVFTGRYVGSPEKVNGKEMTMFALRNVATRSGEENYVTGTYTYDEEEDEISLENYGTLLIYGRGKDGTFDAFMLETESGTRIELDVTKQEEMPDSDMTKKLCRTWVPQSEEIIFKMSEDGSKYQTVLDAKYSYETDMITIKEDMFGYDEEDIEDMFNRTLQKVVFSKAGTYMVYHERGGYEASSMAHWRWQDEKSGKLLYYWGDEQDYDYYAEGIVQVSFEKNNLVVSESYEVSEDGISVIVTSKTSLVEAN